MRKHFLLITTMLLFSYNLKAQFAGGAGTSENPFQIVTPEQLSNLHDYIGPDHSDKYFRLMNDIDLTEFLATGEGSDDWGTKGWFPLGYSFTERFYGKFNGGGHKITGFWINRPNENYVAFFGNLGYPGEVMNLGIETDETLSVIGQQIVSVLAAVNNGTIENCYVKGDAETTFSAGTSIGTITGSNSGTIRYCYANGTIRGRGIMGGLVGRNNIYAQINNCYALVNVTFLNEESDTTTGAFVGENYCGVISNCYSNGWVKYGEVLQPDNGFCGKVDIGTGYDMTGNFWDIETSGSTTSEGIATGKTTLEMKKQSTFTGWDFPATWSIYSFDGLVSYPYLTNNVQSPLPELEYLFHTGTGASDNPFIIKTPKQLNNVRYYIGPDYTDVYFELYNDIDLTDYLGTGDGYTVWGTQGWLPIGNKLTSERFYGKFNGMENKITGLWIYRPETENIALFGYLGTGGAIENLGVEVSESNDIYGNNCTGALCATNSGNISNCYSDGEIIGSNNVGVLAGINYGTITTSYSTGVATGRGSYIGGFTGNNYGTVENCYSKANVTYTTTSLTANNFEASGNFNKGGKIKLSAGPSSDRFGGFVGSNFSGKVVNCYSTGVVRYNSTVITDRGFCGNVDEKGDFEMSGNFWDIETSGSTGSAGNASGKSTTDMKSYITYIGGDWDFMGEDINGTADIWGINPAENNGYPFLSWQGFDNDPAHVTIEIEKTTTPIQIDGVEETIWNFVEPVPIDKNFLSELPTVDAYWKAMWCDSGFFVLLNVHDDDHWPAWESGGNNWEYDWTQVFFDVNDTLIDGGGAGYIETGHYSTNVKFTEDGYDIPVINSPPDSREPGGSYAYSLTGENYVIEHYFPFGNFVNINGNTMNKNRFLSLDEIGFDVTITDQDEGVTSFRHRKVWQSDGTIDECWNNMDGSGAIRLVDRTVENCQLTDTTFNSGESTCFNALDTITVAGDGYPVEFLNGSSVDLIAGQSIRFLPGFHAFEGSLMNAHITTDSTFCVDASVSTIVYQPDEKSVVKEFLPETHDIIPVKKSVKVYPNPNCGQFTLELTNIESGAFISVYNTLGVRVYQLTAIGNTKYEINLTPIQKGIYFIQVNNGKYLVTSKMIVK